MTEARFQKKLGPSGMDAAGPPQPSDADWPRLRGRGWVMAGDSGEGEAGAPGSKRRVSNWPVPAWGGLRLVGSARAASDWPAQGGAVSALAGTGNPERVAAGRSRAAVFSHRSLHRNSLPASDARPRDPPSLLSPEHGSLLPLSAPPPALTPCLRRPSGTPTRYPTRRGLGPASLR